MVSIKQWLRFERKLYMIRLENEMMHTRTTRKMLHGKYTAIKATKAASAATATTTTASTPSKWTHRLSGHGLEQIFECLIYEKQRKLFGKRIWNCTRLQWPSRTIITVHLKYLSTFHIQMCVCVSAINLGQRARKINKRETSISANAHGKRERYYLWRTLKSDFRRSKEPLLLHRRGRPLTVHINTIWRSKWQTKSKRLNRTTCNGSWAWDEVDGRRETGRERKNMKLNAKCWILISLCDFALFSNEFVSSLRPPKDVQKKNRHEY